MKAVAVFEAKNRLVGSQRRAGLLCGASYSRRAGLMPFVLDNSVLTGWYLPDQASAYTEAIAPRLQSDRAWVPALWQMDLANVMTSACTKGQPHAAGAATGVDIVAATP